MSEAIKLVIVDDHQMFLDGISMILGNHENFQIINTFTSAHEAFNSLHTQVPDILITDLNMPEMSGLELTQKIKLLFPDIKVLVLSMHNDRDIVSEIVNVEAEGYILKNSNKRELIRAIETIANGSTYYSNEIISIMLSRYQKQVQQRESLQILSDREREVLELIAQELNNEEIADKLNISRRTVETHRKNMMTKTSVKSIVGLLKFAVKNDLIFFQ